MNALQESIVARWFGPSFDTLAPLLQALYRQGGSLHGVVSIQTGRGLAGWLGRRFVKSIGVPVDRAMRSFAVDIKHTETAMEWVRRFDNGSVMLSRFKPMGSFPTWHWVEETGPLCLQLGVDVTDGGWQWRTLRASSHGVRLPLFLLPRVTAGKHIENGKYIFHVQIALPMMGTVLSYGGELLLRKWEESLGA